MVAGACGVAAGTPLAVLAAIARAARCGAFVKDGAHLEALSQAGAIVFDKTGTLTAGAPAVSKVLPAPGTSPEDLLAVLAAADERLTAVRRTVPDAGGLVIATDRKAARAYARRLPPDGPVRHAVGRLSGPSPSNSLPTSKPSELT